MKILQINVVYKKGSTGKIVYDLHKNLIDNGHRSLVCYGRGSRVEEADVYKAAPELVMKMQSLWSRITGYGYAGCIYSTNNIISLIDQEKPDVIHLQCINGYIVNIYILLNYLKKHNIPTVLTLHAEFMFTGGCGHAFECEQWKTGCCLTASCPEFNKGRPKSYFFDRCNAEWTKFKKSYEGFSSLIICTVSDWLNTRAQQSPFFRDKKIITVMNGLDVSVFCPTDYRYLKEKHNINNEKIILHVTPDFNMPIKGGIHVIELAKRLQDSPVKIIIVGFNGDKSQLPDNVIAVSHTTNQNELAAYYSMADITLLPSKKETYSMVCAESLCCGTPIVGFKSGGPESICLKEYSAFVEHGDIDSLQKNVTEWLKNDFNKEKIAKHALNVYSSQTMYDAYFSVYKMLMEDTKKSKGG